MQEFLIVAVSILGASLMLGILMSPLLLWMWSKHKVAQEKAKAAQEDPVEKARVGRMQERIENLETLMCRLDTEINSQLERSLSMGRLVPSDPGVSQMPTTFMSVAQALESRFQILKELGRGGMGIVFHAHDKQLNEPVAIKVLSPLLIHDPEALERLKREVSAARKITHANIIRIHDLAESGGLHYVSMEYFNGGSLKDYVRKQGMLSLMQAYNIAAQICDGLHEAHRLGIVHRDLKSQNILINSANQIKIIDFGLARNTHLEGMTATGLIMGTPEYMSPEQVSGQKTDERTDIYALGIILYEMFTGRVPFTGTSAIAIGFQQLKDAPPALRETNPQIPVEIEAIILKALQKDPLHRYRSVLELKLDLEKAVLQPPPQSAAEKTPAEEAVRIKT